MEKPKIDWRIVWLTRRYVRERKLIDEIKKAFGPECIKKNTKYTIQPVTRKNLISFQSGDIEIRIDYHFSDNELGFFGTDVDSIDYAAKEIEADTSHQIYYYVLLVYGISEEGNIYFAIPIYFIKNNKDNISKSEYKDSIPPQYKFNIIFRSGKYWLRLKNNQLEDISVFQTDIKGLLNKNLINRYGEEKEKYFSIEKDKEGLLRKLVK